MIFYHHIILMSGIVRLQVLKHFVQMTVWFFVFKWNRTEVTRTFTVSKFHYTFFVAKRILINDVITIFIERFGGEEWVCNCTEAHKKYSYIYWIVRRQPVANICHQYNVTIVIITIFYFLIIVVIINTGTL